MQVKKTQTHFLSLRSSQARTPHHHADKKRKKRLHDHLQPQHRPTGQDHHQRHSGRLCDPLRRPERHGNRRHSGGSMSRLQQQSINRHEWSMWWKKQSKSNHTHTYSHPPPVGHSFLWLPSSSSGPLPNSSVLSSEQLLRVANHNSQSLQLISLPAIKTVFSLQVLNGHFVHYFAPKDLPVVPKNVVFVIDTSASMLGTKIRQVKISWKLLS